MLYFKIMELLKFKIGDKVKTDEHGDGIIGEIDINIKPDKIQISYLVIHHCKRGAVYDEDENLIRLRRFKT